MSLRGDFIAGAKAVSPLVPPAATVGLVTGVAATSVGLSQIQTIGMAVVVYSPTVMLTAFALLESEAPLIVLIVASLVVGARFVMLSLSIAPYFRRLSTSWKWMLAYFLWTPVYALSIERYEAAPTTSRRGYYLGTALPLWIVFQAALIVGVVFGASVPGDLQLGFIVPLAFIALLMRMVSDRPSSVAALVAGVIAVFASALPLNVGIIAAAVGGTLAGVLYTGRRGR